jgi:aminoglycoside 6'-N-acetyltransferase
MRTDPDFMHLETERLILRRSLPEDAEAIAAYRSDPTVHVTQGWTRTDADHVRSEAEEMLTRLPGAQGWVQFSVLERDGGRLVGDVGICPAEDEPGVMKIGYTVAPAAQGRGYATEAVSALIDYAFDMLEAEVVRAYADADNLPSRRVMEKVGMTLIDVFHGQDEDGPWTGVRYERSQDEDEPA